MLDHARVSKEAMPLKSSHESLKNEKALRKIETKPTPSNHYRNGFITLSVNHKL